MIKPGDYKTVGGADAKVFLVQEDYEYTSFPVMGAIKVGNGFMSMCWRMDGACGSASKNDLLLPDERNEKLLLAKELFGKISKICCDDPKDTGLILSHAEAGWRLV